MENITINEIAKLAGVSKATVSRVLNNSPHVDKETRARILRIISENDYLPNDTAKILAAQNTKTVGILVADIRWTHYSHGVFYVEDEFSRNGYMSITINTGTDPEMQAEKIKYLSRRRVDAIVLIGSVFQNTAVQNAIMVHAPNIPVAICNGYLDGPNIYGVIVDERGGVEESVKLLAQKGHKNFAFMYNRRTQSTINKEEGFLAGFDKYVKGGSRQVIEAGVKTEDMLAHTLRAVKGNPRVDAIIYSEDFLAITGTQAILESGLSIPKDVAVVGINNTKHSEIMYPALTTIDNMLYDTCTIAVRNLVAVMNGERVNHKMLIFTELIERKST